MNHFNFRSQKSYCTSLQDPTSGKTKTEAGARFLNEYLFYFQSILRMLFSTSSNFPMFNKPYNQFSYKIRQQRLGSEANFFFSRSIACKRSFLLDTIFTLRATFQKWETRKTRRSNNHKKSLKQTEVDDNNEKPREMPRNTNFSIMKSRLVK